MRQRIPNKPIRMGYKVWCINSKDGYLNTFTMYQGKGSQNEYSSDYGLRLGPSKFVLDLVRYIVRDYLRRYRTEERLGR